MAAPKPTAKQRWQTALQTRNMQREEMRNSSFRNTPLAKATAMPTADMMVRRGTRMMMLSGTQASETTRKSWQKRKETYGKKGRASSLTFNKIHKKVKL